MNRAKIIIESAVAARRTLQAHGVDLTRRINVFELLAAEGLVVAFRPLPRLAGAYLPDAGPKPGVMINSNHPVSKQRYTAAHELGHHRLGHGESLDAETGFGSADNARPADEVAAEAFAGHLLLPRQLLRAAESQLGADVHTEEGCYRIAVFAGASFLAVATQALVYKMLDRAEYEHLAAVVPAKVKRRLAGEPTVAVGAGDVVHADMASATIVKPGDVLSIPRATEEALELGPHLTLDSEGTAAGQPCWRVRVDGLDPVNPDEPAVASFARTEASTYEIAIERARSGIAESEVRLK